MPDHQVRRRPAVDPVSGEPFDGRDGAAGDLVPLEDLHLPPGLRQIGRGDQAVVAPADDDGVAPRAVHR